MRELVRTSYHKLKSFVLKPSNANYLRSDKINPTDIFLDLERFDWFKQNLEEIGVIGQDGKAKARGFQAVANAFYRCDKKKIIFKRAVTLKTYIKFLRAEFNAQIKSDEKLSYGGNWFNDIDLAIEKYQNELSNDTTK